MKKISRQRTCPQCDAAQDWKRLWLKNMITARWACRNCGTALRFDWSRRVAVAGVGGLLTGLAVFSTGWLHWWALPLALPFFLYIWSFDSVCRAEGPRPAVGEEETHGT